MVRINLLSDCFGIHHFEMYEFLQEQVSPITIGSLEDGDTPDDGHADHHYCVGGERWQYHFVRTTLSPAEEDLYLYNTVFGAPGFGKEPVLHRIAMYVEFTHDADAVMFKLICRGR